MHGDQKNSLRLEATYDITDRFSKTVFNFQFSYTQPNTFFRLEGRRAIHLLYISGTTKLLEPVAELRFYGVSENKNISQFGVGITQEVAFWKAGGFYVGGGIGPYVKEHKNDFVNARFMFGVRGFAGYSFGDFNIELLFLHFSDGHLSELNCGMNTFGLGVSYNF